MAMNYQGERFDHRWRRLLMGRTGRRPELWVRRGVVLGVLVASLAASLLPDWRILLLILALPGAWFLVRFPQSGLVGAVVASLLVPLEVGTGSGSSVNAPMLVIAGLTGLWLLGILTRQLDAGGIDRPTTIPLVVLLVVTGLSFVSGNFLVWFPAARMAPLTAQLGGIGLVVLSILGYVWVSANIDDERWLRLAVWVFLGLSGLYMLARALNAPPILQFFQYGAYGGSMFYTWVVALATGQGLLNRRLSPAGRTLLLGVTGLTLYVALIQAYGWKSGWIPPVVALGIIVLIWKPRLALPLALLGIFPVLDLIAGLAQSDAYSLSTRVDAWVILADIFRANPLLGLGPSNYYFFTILFPIRGYAVSFNSHNQYVDLLVQYGVAGLLAYLWFLAAVGRLLWRARQYVPAGFGRAYLGAAAGGLIAMLVSGMLGDWLLPFVYNVGFTGFRASVLSWLFLGGAAALSRIYAPTEPAAAGDD